MKVQIIANTPELEKVVAAAAKLCYSPVGVEEISENMSEDQAISFLDKLVQLGHYSPLEHASITFAIEGVSRVLTHQLVRHRIASYSQQSQRYVKLNQFEYIIPPMIKQLPEALEIFEKAMQADQEAYDALVDCIEPIIFDQMISEGMPEKVAKQAASKKAIEDARFVFPNACETKIVATMNIRSLLNFFEHRCCDRAQWEIRELANEMLKQVKRIAPTIFCNAGPSCVRMGCKEGKMSCGKMAEMRAFYKEL